MLITTSATFNIEDFIKNGPKATPLSWTGYAYFGPIAFCKKGRGGLQQSQNTGNSLASTAAGVANGDQALQAGYRNAGDSLMNSMTSTNGGLSTGLRKQLANEQGQTGQVYQRVAQAGLKGLAARGMGAAPTGAASSIANTAGNEAAGAQTGEIGNAYGQQNQLNLAGANYNQGQEQIFNPLNAVQAGSGAVNAATNAGQAVNKAGSTLGDIGSGLGTLASLASPFKAMGGFSGIGSTLKYGSN